MDLTRTAWFEPEIDPTIPGPYECVTGGGYVFQRKWNGTSWLSSVDGNPSTLRMPWRGVIPGTAAPTQYSRSTRETLEADININLFKE